jgi:hypothetical protein
MTEQPKNTCTIVLTALEAGQLVDRLHFLCSIHGICDMEMSYLLLEKIASQLHGGKVTFQRPPPPPPVETDPGVKVSCSPLGWLKGKLFR